MPDLTPEERLLLGACATPDARCALLLEWILLEMRRQAAPKPQTAQRAAIESGAFALDDTPAPPKRGPGQTRKGGGR